MDGEIITSPVMSYTKGLTYLVNVSQKFLKKEDNILLIDDFLANRSALLGLADIMKKGGAKVAGAGIVIEKSFQPGRKRAEEEGLNVYSLIRIESIIDGKVTFKEEK